MKQKHFFFLYWHCCYTFVILPHGYTGQVLIHCNYNFLGVTIKEKHLNSGATLVDVGLFKVHISQISWVNIFYFPLNSLYFLFLSFPLFFQWHPSQGHLIVFVHIFRSSLPCSCLDIGFWQEVQWGLHRMSSHHSYFLHFPSILIWNCNVFLIVIIFIDY